MGRMKNLWIEMEQAQAERDLEAMEATGSTRKRPIKLWRLPIESEAQFKLWRLLLERAKNTYGLECVFLYGWTGTVEVAAQVNQSLGVTPPRHTFTDFILDVDPFRSKIGKPSLLLKCPKCGCNSPKYLALQSDREINTPDDVLNNEMICIVPNAGAGGCPGLACAYKGMLHHFLAPVDVKSLYTLAKNWLYQKMYTAAPGTPPATATCYPPPIPGSGYDDDEDDYNPSAKELEKDARKTGEAAKPFGTRDVEKFQKEEKDRQLRELFGC